MRSPFREAFRKDVRDTFLSQERLEFNTIREFSRKGRSGTMEVVNLNVIWHEDTLKNISGVVSYGQLMIGDILMMTKKEDWPIRPRRYQLIYSPRDTQWEIITCQEVFKTVYRIQLIQKVPTS